MTLAEDRQKWERRYAEQPPQRPEPHPMVLRWQAWVPPGPLLDAACGLGRGIASAPAHCSGIVAVDLSLQGIRQARRLWAERGGIDWLVADVATLPLPAGHFAMICAFGFTDWHFLRRASRLLMPGGVLFYEGFSPRQRAVRPNLNADWTATPAQLRQLFARWRLLECAESTAPPYRTRLAAVRPTEPEESHP